MKFRAYHQNQMLQDLNTFPQQPKISFILSWLSTPSDALATLRSIESLQGEDWEVLLVNLPHGSDINHPVYDDPRIMQIQSDDPHLLDRITGEFVIFCTAGDQFSRSLFTHFFETFSDHPQADILYYDCEYYDEDTDQIKPLFKPNSFSPALLLSINYLSRAFIRHQAMQEIWADMAPYPNLLTQEYEIALRLCEKDGKFCHIPHILLTQKSLVSPVTPENQNVVAGHLARQGLKTVSPTKGATGVRFSWAHGSPSLAIIILSKNNFGYLQNLVPALMHYPYEGSLTIHIVDNESRDPATLAYYDDLQAEPHITIIPYAKAFNYSEAINLGIAHSHSDLVLLMNDDMAIKDELWLSELTQWAVRPEVGVVGAKLLRKNNTIQHAGIVLGLTGFMGHIYLNAPEHYNGLLGSADWYRNYLAVTGACQMVRREVFNEVGGYDQGYQLAFGDIDFCLKVHEKGYQNIYTPFAQLYHYEGSSRGYLTPVEDVLRGYQQLEKYLVEEDPFFSPNLTYTRIPKCSLETRSKDQRRLQIETRKRFFQSN